VNKIDITLDNMAQLVVVVPPRKKRGRTKIYEGSSPVVYSWGVNSEDNDTRKEQRDHIRKAVGRVGADNVFVKSISIFDNKHERKSFSYSDNQFETSLKRHDIRKIISSGFKGVDSISISTIPKFISYFPVTQWGSSLDDQKDMLRELAWKMNMDIVEDFMDSSYDEPYETMAFKSNEMDGDYSLVHGSSYCESNCILTAIDGRLGEYNDAAADNFWSFEYEQMVEYFNEKDKDDKLTVFHRKGKDWYVAKAYDQEQVFIKFKDEEGYEQEEEFWMWTTASGVDELKRDFEEYISDIHSYVEIQGRVYNMLRIGNNDSYYSSHDEDDLFNIEILRKEFDDDLWEVAYQILDMSNNFNENVESVATAAYENFLKSTMDDKERIFGKYSHLQKIRKLAEEDGRKVVRSKPHPAAMFELYAIEYNGEEYHFELREMLNTSPKKLYTMAAKGLTKRMLEKKERGALLKKASSVFVGIEDSIDSGNCMSGTKSFCLKHGIDTSKIGGIRGDVLLSYDYSNFTRRAVIEALAKAERRRVVMKNNEKTKEMLRNIYESVLKNRGVNMEQRKNHRMALGYEEMVLIRLGAQQFSEISIDMDGTLTVFGYRVVEVCCNHFIGISRVIYDGEGEKNV
jgi:hypothetical protein